jgi:hypothetical protein
MMTIYEFAVVEGQEWVLPADENCFEFFLGLDGTSLGDRKLPLMKRVSDGDPL